MKTILSFLFILFLIISFFNISYNLIKIPFEIKNWAFLNSSDKRVKTFGDYYSFLEKLNNLVLINSKTLFVYDNDRDFFLARYFLYPKKVDMLWIHSDAKIKDIESFDYIISNDNSFTTKGFVKDICIELTDESEIRCIFKKE